MTLLEMENRAMMQAGEDPDDLSEQLPYMTGWINEGYHALLVVRYGDSEAEEYEALSVNSDEPELPEWVHGAIADYATYRLLLTGSAQRQNRAQAFLMMFNDAKARLQSEKEKEVYEGFEDGALHMRNLYVRRTVY